MECMCAQTIPLIRKSFGGIESEPILIPREISPLPEKNSSEQDRGCIEQDSEPNTPPKSYSGPSNPNPKNSAVVFPAEDKRGCGHSDQSERAVSAT